MLEIRKFCCTNINNASQWCHCCCHQSSNAHRWFDHARGRLAEENYEESEAFVGNSCMSNNPSNFDGSCWKNGFFVTNINYSFTFWRWYCSVELLNYCQFLRFLIKSWFLVNSEQQKNSNNHQKCYSLLDYWSY